MALERYTHPEESEEVSDQPHNVVLTNYDRLVQDEGKLAGWERASAEYEQRGLRGLVKKVKYNFLRQDQNRKHIKEAQKQVKSNTETLLLRSPDAEAAAAGMSLDNKPFVSPEEVQAYRDMVALDENHEERLNDRYAGQRDLLEAQLQNRIDFLSRAGDRSRIRSEVSAWVDGAIAQLPQYYRAEDKELFVQQISESVEEVMDRYDKAVAESKNTEEALKINLHLAGADKYNGKSRTRAMLVELATHPLTGTVWTGARIAAKAVLFAPVVGGVLAAARKRHSVNYDLERMQMERVHGLQGKQDKYRRSLSETFVEEINATDLITRLEGALAATNVTRPEDADPGQIHALAGAVGMLTAVRELKLSAVSYEHGGMQRQKLQLLQLQSRARLRLRQLKREDLIVQARNEAAATLQSRYQKQEQNQRKLKNKKMLQAGITVGAISAASLGLGAVIPDEWSEAAVDKVASAGKLAWAKAVPSASAAANPIESVPVDEDVEVDTASDEGAEIVEVDDEEAVVEDVAAAEGNESEPQSLWQELINQQDQRDQSHDTYITYGTDIEGEHNELELKYEPSDEGIVINVSGMEGNADGVGGDEFPEGEQLYAVFYLTDADKEIGNEIRVPIPEDGRLVISEDSHPELLPLFETTNGEVEQQFAVLGIASENEDGSYTFYASNWEADIPQQVIEEMKQAEAPQDYTVSPPNEQNPSGDEAPAPPVDEEPVEEEPTEPDPDAEVDENGNPIVDVGAPEEVVPPPVDEPAPEVVPPDAGTTEDDDDEDAAIFGFPWGATADHRGQMSRLKNDEQPQRNGDKPTATVTVQNPTGNAESADASAAVGVPSLFALGQGQPHSRGQVEPIVLPTNPEAMVTPPPAGTQPQESAATQHDAPKTTEQAPAQQETPRATEQTPTQQPAESQDIQKAAPQGELGPTKVDGQNRNGRDEDARINTTGNTNNSGLNAEQQIRRDGIEPEIFRAEKSDRQDERESRELSEERIYQDRQNEREYRDRSESRYAASMSESIQSIKDIITAREATLAGQNPELLRVLEQNTAALQSGAEAIGLAQQAIDQVKEMADGLVASENATNPEIERIQSMHSSMINVIERNNQIMELLASQLQSQLAQSPNNAEVIAKIEELRNDVVVGREAIRIEQSVDLSERIRRLRERRERLLVNRRQINRPRGRSQKDLFGQRPEPQPESEFKPLSSEEYQQKAAKTRSTNWIRKHAEGRYYDSTITDIRRKAQRELRAQYPDNYDELWPQVKTAVKDYADQWQAGQGDDESRKDWLESIQNGQLFASMLGEVPSAKESDQPQPAAVEAADNGATIEQPEFPVKPEDMDDYEAGRRAQDRQTVEEYNESNAGRQQSERQRERRESRDARRAAERGARVGQPVPEVSSSNSNEVDLRIEPVEVKSEIHPNQKTRRDEFNQNDTPSPEEARGIEIYLKKALNFMPLPNSAKNKLRPAYDQHVEQFMVEWGNLSPDERESRMNEIFSGKVVNDLIAEQQPATEPTANQGESDKATVEPGESEQQRPADGSVETLERLVKRFGDDRRINYSARPINNLNNEQFGQQYSTLYSQIDGLLSNPELSEAQQSALQFLKNSYNLLGKNLGERTSPLGEPNFGQLQSELSEIQADVKSKIDSWQISPKPEEMSEAEYKAEQINKVKSEVIEPMAEQRTKVHGLLAELYSDIEGVREQSSQVKPHIESLPGSEDLFARADEVLERIEREAGRLSEQLRDINGSIQAFEQVLDAWQQAA